MNTLQAIQDDYMTGELSPIHASILLGQLADLYLIMAGNAMTRAKPVYLNKRVLVLNAARDIIQDNRLSRDSKGNISA